MSVTVECLEAGVRIVVSNAGPASVRLQGFSECGGCFDLLLSAEETLIASRLLTDLVEAIDYVAVPL